MVDEVGEQDVLPAGEGIGLDADHVEQPGDVPLDLVGHGFVVGSFGGPVEPAHDVEWHAGRRPRRVDRELGGVAELRDPAQSDVPFGEPLRPLLGHLGGVGVLDPRGKVVGLELGEREQQVPEVALGIDDQSRYPRQQCLLDEHDA
jgi:hypothetical protein